MKAWILYIELVIALGFFVVLGLPVISSEIKGLRVVAAEESRFVVETAAESYNQKLDVVSGDTILGMILSAVKGEYVIIVDGVTINSSTNMDNVMLTGVVGHTYKISFVKNSSTGETTVTAVVVS